MNGSAQGSSDHSISDKDVAQNVTDFNDIFDNSIGKVHGDIFSHFQSLRVKMGLFLEKKHFNPASIHTTKRYILLCYKVE